MNLLKIGKWLCSHGYHKVPKDWFKHSSWKCERCGETFYNGMV